MPRLTCCQPRRPWAAFLGLLGALGAALLAACTPIPATEAPTTAAPTHTPAATQAPLAAEATPTPAPTASQVPPTLTATPTAHAVGQPTLGYYNITPRADATLVTPFPTPVAAVQLEAGVVNILLIGTDSRPYLEKGFRTDTLIIASINKDSHLVSLVSIPRDLFVYVPTWGMTRINTAYDAGERVSYPGGGSALLGQTILYNLGIPIHYYAAINFTGFRQIVDTLGGIDVSANCPLVEYKLKAPDLDETVVENYELYSQPIGVTHMDGEIALWYARARPIGGDYFRSYRQRQVLRAIYRAALTTDVVPQLPGLYGDFQDVVATDMGLWDLMQFAPLAADVQDAQIRSFAIGPNQTTPWLTPKGDDVLLPKPGPLAALIKDALSPPSVNQLQRPLTRVEIVNASGQPDWASLAAETLRNEGFVPVFGPAAAEVQAVTRLTDLTTTAKGSPVKLLQSLLHVADKQVVAEPAADSPVQFRVTLGQDYVACPRLDWIAPLPTPTP